ncbi:MAG: arylamine N-acetyltransferase [Solirubrobacterales bacterium]|nr:arylamine N-acetyltransferase [Solirubrobacterales bacterium]
MIDLDAYLARIGLSGEPTVANVHRAHATSVPFENLDPRRGVPVSLAAEDLERKLVAERRGGYCFEQNLLLKSALESLGAEVELLLARVRVGGTPGVPRPRSHLVLRVSAGGETLHADVGFGMGTLLEPLPFGPGDPHEQSGWCFRVVQDGPELVLQIKEDAGWSDLYGLPAEPVPLVDVETANWFTSTHPRSPFVTGLMISAQDADGKRTSLSDWEGLALSERTPGGATVTPVTREAVPQLLSERFGLAGFAFDGDDRLVREQVPSGDGAR